MAPGRELPESIGHQPFGHDEFFEKLRAFHAQRGTNLDTNARVNGKHIDLFKLFDVVGIRGGYDVVSSEKLAWRKVGQEFNLGQTNTAAYAFALKTVYYKNLAAFEIKFIHNQEPPPKEILENISAKGGDLLTRSVENFRPPQSREQQTNGNESEGSGEEEGKTPKEEKMDLDDPGSGGGRTTRGLRQAPPQRVLFQPDVSSSRQVRHTSSHLQSPQPTAGSVNGGYAYNPSSNPNSMSFSIANYEPRPQMPLTLRPVVTPGNNPSLFQEKVRLMRAATASRLGDVKQSYKGMMLPGTGFEGPNIYVRTLNALRSGVPEEQDYALHHLVKISHERGDKYKFEAFPGLAEGLVEKILEVSTLFYNIQWEISYAEDESRQEVHVLDGLNGTADILDRIRALQPLDVSDDVEAEEFGRKLSKINEASLVIRNMSLLEENAKYLSNQCPLRDLLSIALNLPHSPALTELKHYALDIAEQLTRYWLLDASDPLYLSLLMQLESSDRGAILTTLRTISRISMNLEESNQLKGVPLSVINRIFDWVLLEDEELVHACLDFLYQYTATPENVAFLLSQTRSKLLSLHPLLSQLTRLLLYNAKKESTVGRIVSPAIRSVAATEIPSIPRDLLEQVIKHGEPERSSHWLRACFEEDSESDITQIALWHAYQTRFSEFATPDNHLLAAADFIKNVSATFPTANAQVINGQTQKFIIKGIRPRHLPMDSKNRVYSRCLWKSPGSPKVCGKFFLKPQDMWEHIVFSHIQIPRNTEGNFDIHAPSLQDSQTYECYWANCHHFASGGGTNSPYELGMHVKTHLPDISKLASHKAQSNRSLPSPFNPLASSSPHDYIYAATDLKGRDAVREYQPWYNTATDERGDAAGLPLTSVLVLRNLARNIPKAVLGLEDNEMEMGGGASSSPSSSLSLRAGGEGGWMERLLGPLRGSLWFAMAHNRPLAGYVGDLIAVVERVIGS